jgi:hypothetical protein
MIVRLHHSREAEHDEGRTRARIFGEEASCLYPGRTWGEVEPQMAGEWGEVRGSSHLSWSQVRSDAHAAWQLAWLRNADRQRDDAPVTMLA